MQKLLIACLLCLVTPALRAQKIDSICFHLYTDSLKKGTHNYINVDGKMDNGKWLPLTAKDITFTASACSFSGNDLVVPADFAEEKVTVTARLKSNPSTLIEKTIWVKKLPDPEWLSGKEDILRDGKSRRKKDRLRNP